LHAASRFVRVAGDASPQCSARKSRTISVVNAANSICAKSTARRESTISYVSSVFCAWSLHLSDLRKRPTSPPIGLARYALDFMASALTFAANAKSAADTVDTHSGLAS
jgi:hypothetical protein